MTLLALDTATSATALALCRAGCEPLEARDDPPPGARPRHATHVLVLAAELLGESGQGWDALDRIAVGVGPGTFTGLRIGLATAQALAQARALPLVGVSTLASLALGAWPAARAEGCELVVSVIDARRGEVFAAAWEMNGEEGPEARLVDPGSPRIAPCAVAPTALAEQLSAAGGRAMAVGDGAIAFRADLERSGALVAGDGADLHRVSARHHCRLAAGLPDSAPGKVRPQYLRVPDAELNRLHQR